MKNTDSNEKKDEIKYIKPLTTGRIEALSDGIFAIVMTLLVLEIKIPELHGDHIDLISELVSRIPMLISFIISFILLGVYWIGHHNQYIFIHKTDRNFLWINIMFLMFVSLLPFSTALLGNYHTEKVPVICYGANLILIGIVLWYHWHYATKNNRLTTHDVDKVFIKKVHAKILIGPIIYLVAILLVFVNQNISLALFMITPIYFIFQGKIGK